MSAKFPHLTNNESDFPNVGNVNVYKYDNEFDYERYNATQMELIICSVPWDMGEAHIGNRTISGVGNVVYFETKEERDAWFDAIPDDECYRFETKFKELHRDHVIDVPIPYDMCARHNYLVVRYALFANDDSPVMYEGADGAREWFWFVREVEFIAPNTTRLHLLEDAWQTWIYDIDVTGMILERGHAPMFAVDVDDYLENPVDNNEYLLTEDVNFGEIGQVKHIDVLELNAGNMYACIATTANPQGSWGTKAADTWNTPALSSYTNSGAPSVYVFAVAVANLNSFLANVTSSVPQFKQTIQGVFFASDDLITLGTPFTFASTTCYPVSASRKTLDVTKLDKALFGYGSDYAEIAKLYTSPYAHIEITDENGVVDIVKIEDSTGTLKASVALSIAYPFVNIESHLLGVGGIATATVTYKNVSSHTFPVSGQWYETLRSWKVPTFAVILDAATEYDYSTHFDRIQRENDYTTAYDNATASNQMAYDNATGTNQMAYDNAIDANQMIYDNTVDTDLMVYDNAVASDLMAYDNAKKTAETIYDNEIRTQAGLVANKNDAKTCADNKIDTITDGGSISTVGGSGGYLADTYDAQLNKLSDDNDADVVLMVQQSQLTNDAIAAGAVVNAAGTIGGGIVTGASMGSIGSVPGAIAGAVGGAVAQGASIGASTMITISNNSSMVTNNRDHSRKKFESARDALISLNNAQIAYNHNIKEEDNAYLESTVERFSGNPDGINRKNASDTKTAADTNALNTQTVNDANALNTQSTNDANALNTKDTNDTIAQNTKTVSDANALNTQTVNDANALRTRNNAVQDVQNDIQQAALRSPFICGQFADGESAVTKPIALFSHIVTQDKGAISSAGDEMLRYGYMLERQWNFTGEWNIGRYFTYWKLRDFWVSNLNVPDMYMDRIRFFLYGGVTVWRKPEDIGKRSIYDNFR